MWNHSWMLWKKYYWAQTFVNYFIVFPLISFLIWSLGYILFGRLALPGGSLFALGVLELSGIILGHVFESCELPPLLGMLTAGLILRNVPHLDFAKDLDYNMTTPLRSISVVVLLTRGALSVNPAVIRKFIWVIPQLAVGACIIEASAGALTAYFIMGFPVAWAALIGCIMSGMSGATTTPYLNRLENRGLGLTNNMITIAKTACGLDAILAISMCKVAGGFVFANGELVDGLQKGILEVAMGLTLAIIWGSLAGIFLEENHGSLLRTFVLFGGGIMSLTGLTKIGFPRGSPPSCFFGALIASCFWRNKGVDGKSNDKVNKNFLIIWDIFQPMLFGIIGSRTDFLTVDWNLMIRGIICFLISLSVRMISVFFLVCFSDLTIKEKIALSLTWVPKGTVQAALGPIALETVFAFRTFDESRAVMAYKVMNISVLIIILAPSLGAFLLTIIVPRLLKRSW